MLETVDRRSGTEPTLIEEMRRKRIEFTGGGMRAGRNQSLLIRHQAYFLGIPAPPSKVCRT
ncbi:MAG TPA: hypothetical protein VF947_08580, partial [Myxococcales bacterium]